MKFNSKYHYILDNGHGGLINGEYVTAPKKMWKFQDGTTIYEGVFNRSIVGLISDQLGCSNISHSVLVPEEEDISLRERVRRINITNRTCGKKTIMISIHGNAGKGNGFEVFTSKGQTKSDPIADVFIEELAKMFPYKRMRVDNSDGDMDKEANFTILMCNGIAILSENGFMDNIDDAKMMMSENGQFNIAQGHVNAIKRIEDL